MPTYTPRLKLIRRILGEPFLLQDYSDNWAKIDASPGTLVIDDAGDLPNDWTSAETGNQVIAVDTGLRWWWNGTDFVRSGPLGLLDSEASTTPINTTSTSLVNALSVSVDVPGGRKVEVSVTGPGAYNTAGLCRLALFRDSTQLQSWLLRGTLSDGPLPVSMTVLDTTVVAGPATYSLLYSAVAGTGGTSHIQADTDTPLALHVKEV